MRYEFVNSREADHDVDDPLDRRPASKEEPDNVPIAAEKATEAETQFYQTIRAGLLAFAKGMGPMISVEFARRAIPPDLRPTFHQMEAAFKTTASREQAAA